MSSLLARQLCLEVMNESVFLSVYDERLIMKYSTYWKESAMLWENIPYVKLYEYNKKYVLSEVEGCGKF
jgi:hypothetical protein